MTAPQDLGAANQEQGERSTVQEDVDDALSAEPDGTVFVYRRNDVAARVGVELLRLIADRQVVVVPVVEVST